MKDTDTQTPAGQELPVTFWEQRGDEMHKIADVPGRYRDSIYALIQEAGQTIHPNSEPVRVIAVDVEEAKKYYPPLSGAQPCHEEQLFPSAIAASHHLGFSLNEVARRLSKARKDAERETAQTFGAEHTVRLRPSVTIRGVTLQYERDVPG